MTRLQDYDGTGITYTHDAEGRVIKQTHSDGSTTDYDYNTALIRNQSKALIR